MLGTPCWREESLALPLVGFAGRLGVSATWGRVWLVYINSVPGCLFTVSQRRLFKAGGWEACGRPLGLAHGLRSQAEDMPQILILKEPPRPNKNRSGRQRPDSTGAWRRL